MNSTEQMSLPLRRASSWVLGLALVVLTPVAAVGAAEEDAAPQLSITLDNDRETAQAGDDLAYTVTVHNLGTDRVTGLLVTQSVPDGLTFESADSRGVLKADLVSWRLNLRASGKATLQTTMTLAETPATLLRLASVACANTSTKDPPSVCATDSDQLPAGSVAQAAVDDGDAPRASLAIWIAAGLAIILGLAAIVFRQSRDRNHRRDVGA